MHSFVYELARTPVRPDCYARAGNLPDWFYEQVCDYAENTDPPQREQAIADLSHFLGPLCTRKGDRLDFAPNLRDSFFRRGYVCFRAAAEVLAQTAYAVFSGSEKAPAFDLALSGLNDSYEDRYGVYVYTGTTNTLEPLDRWLRYADLSRPVYVGWNLWTAGSAMPICPGRSTSAAWWTTTLEAHGPPYISKMPVKNVGNVGFSHISHVFKKQTQMFKEEICNVCQR